MTEYMPAGKGPLDAAPPLAGLSMPESVERSTDQYDLAMPVERSQLPTSLSGLADDGSLLPGEWEHDDTHMLGLATITAAAGTFVGARFGGPYGAVAGVLLGGAAINTLRAIKLAMHGEPMYKKEALVSGTYAVICAGLGGWLGYYGHKRKKGESHD